MRPIRAGRIAVSTTPPSSSCAHRRLVRGSRACSSTSWKTGRSRRATPRPTSRRPMPAEWYQRTRVLDAALLEVHDRLATAGIDHRVIKGAATAVRGLRRHVATALCGHRCRDRAVGLRRRARPAHHRALAATRARSTAGCRRAPRAVGDAHRREHGARPPSDARASAGGRPAAAGSCLRRPRSIVRARRGGASRAFRSPTPSCTRRPTPPSTTSSAPPLLRARDLVGLAAQASADARAERARAWGLEATVESCLSASRARLGLERGDASPRAPGPEEATALALHARDASVGRLWSLPRWPDKVTWAVATAVPSREYLRHVGETRWGRIRRTWRRSSGAVRS